MSSVPPVTPQARLEAALPAALDRIRQTPAVYAALWCGSAARGEGNDLSDLDLHVLVTGDERWRSSFTVHGPDGRGVQVEVFHNPLRKVRAMFGAGDAATLAMYAGGRPVLPHPDLEAVQAEARALLDAGRVPQPVNAWDRFALLETVMDARAEQHAPAHAAYVMLGVTRHAVPLLYRLRGWWDVPPRHWLADLEARDPAVAAELHACLTVPDPARRQAAFEALARRVTGDFTYHDLDGERQRVPQGRTGGPEGSLSERRA